MKIIFLVVGLFLLNSSATSSVDLHEIIQLSDHIVFATVTDVCEDTVTATVLKTLKGEAGESIDIQLHSTDLNINQSYDTNQNYIFFIENMKPRELRLLFSLKEYLDDKDDKSYILIDNKEVQLLKLMPFIHAVESYIYNEQEISLAQLN